MEANHKKILKAISLELRHLLEGHYDSNGKWQPGDLEQRLAAIGVRRDREPVPMDELAHLSDDDKHARTVVDAYIQLRDEADVSREEAVAEFVRETAYTWANRLLCLRCMEARELIDEVILQKEAYGGRSLEHHRLAQRDPEVCSGEDDGLFAVLEKVFTDQTEHLPLLFDPQSPGVALWPSPAVLKRCLALLSGIEAVRSQEPATGEVFQAPDALGWAYQFWNTEEKERVFASGDKIAGADIIPATQFYTEPYMVKFLVQNSLGATWMGMYPDSKLYEKWEYYVRDADRTAVEKKPMAQITFLDPACGSGHFLIEAFDLYYDMYVEEGKLTEPEDICRSILEKNLFGIDIDARAIQIAEAALWMKAAERAFGFQGAATNLVAAVASHLKGDLWEEFLAGFEREPSVARVLRKFGQTMEHIDELGSLARPEEELRAIIHEEHATWERQVREKAEANFLFPEMVEEAVSGHLPFQEISDEEFGDRLLYRARAAIDAFSVKAREEAVFHDQLLGHETSEGFRLFGLLSRKYDTVAANPPYMGLKTMGPTLKTFLEARCPNSCTNLFASFVERASHLIINGGRIAFVAQSVLLYLGSFRELRLDLYDRMNVETGAHLGPGAFEEISGEKVNTVLFVASSRVGKQRLERGVFVRAVGQSNKAKVLTSSSEDTSFEYDQQQFQRLTDAQFIYWAPEEVLALLADSRTVGTDYDTAVGLQTGNNPRYIRYRWEAPAKPRWTPLTMGGSNVAFYRSDEKVIDWGGDGFRVRMNPSAVIRNSQHYFKRGVTFSRNVGVDLRTRIMEEGTVFDQSSSAVIAGNDSFLIMSLFNSSTGRYLMQFLSPGLSFLPSDLGKMPLVDVPPVARERIELNARRSVDSLKNLERILSPNVLAESDSHQMDVSGGLHKIVEGIGQQAHKELQNARHAQSQNDSMWCELYGMQEKLVASYVMPDAEIGATASEILSGLMFGWVCRICEMDEDGIVPVVEVTREATAGNRIRQEISNDLHGYESGPCEQEFAEIMGVPLDRWIGTEFFKVQLSRLNKRPLIWQLQSGKFTARKTPAFACLVYCQKLDGDLLPKIRNQYVGPLRIRLETELRSIESVSADTRSDRQQGRRGELEDQIDELRDFDTALQKVTTEGFASKELTKIVKDEPLDKWCSLDGTRPEPENQEALLQQESRYFPDINDGVRVNIAPLQKAGLLAADVLTRKDLDKAIADRAQWRADERRWCREDKLPQPGWWPEERRDTIKTQTLRC